MRKTNKTEELRDTLDKELGLLLLDFVRRYNKQGGADYLNIIRYIESKLEEKDREIVETLINILESIENPQHKYYSNPKRYIESIKFKYLDNGKTTTK